MPAMAERWLAWCCIGVSRGGRSMIDKARIEEEAQHFFTWPTADRSAVTLTSCLIFAGTVAEMVRGTELAPLRAAAEKARAALSELLMTRDPVVYADALRALDDALGPNVRAHPRR